MDIGSQPLVLAALTFVVAFLYSSVGHGGASGYLAVLSFFSFPHEERAASALCLNLLVAGLSFFAFLRASHFSWKLTWPFLAASVPLAFVGGLIKVSPATYSLLLAGVLIFAAARLLMDIKSRMEETRPPHFLLSLLLGGGIGILSGMVGVGGGIFLSPLLILLGWAGTKQAAGASAFFILVNSVAGLGGRYARDSVHLAPSFLIMVAAAFFGGLFGSRLGANFLPGAYLRRILALVLLIAAFKLLKPSGP